MDCEQFRSALIDGEPGLERHAAACPACATLLVATSPARVSAGSARALRLDAGRPPVMRTLMALAALVTLGVLGARVLQRPLAPPVTPRVAAAPAAVPRDLGDPFADPAVDDLDEPLSLPTDLLTSAVLHRSPR